jgi:hypothetical protein
MRPKIIIESMVLFMYFQEGHTGPKRDLETALFDV